MDKGSSDDSLRKQRSLRVEVASRRRELRDTILRNFEVARLNLRDTQLSPEAALIGFYEGVTLSLPPQAQDTKEESFVNTEGGVDLENALENFQNAGKLVEYADSLAVVNPTVALPSQSSLEGFWTVGFHAKFNFVVIKHRRIETRYARTPDGVFSADAFKDLGKILLDYKELDKELQSPRLSSARQELIGVRIATLCGCISCLCAQLQIAQDQEMKSMIPGLTKEVIVARNEVEHLLASARGNGAAEEVPLIEFSVRASIQRLTRGIDMTL